MNPLLRISRLALLVCVAFGVTIATAKAAPPNWKVSAVGTSTLADLDLVNFTRTDVDAFSGHSSHLGQFTATGYHVLDLLTGEFAGVATYTAANSDAINVTYSGQLFPSGDAAFPFGATATIEISGGTGRFADATGGGVLTGGFTGAIPVGDFFFRIEGTLNTK
jgi:hypothetical protein